MTNLFKKGDLETIIRNLFLQKVKKTIFLFAESTSHNNTLSYVFIYELIKCIPKDKNITFFLEANIPYNWNYDGWNPNFDLKTHQCKSSRYFFFMIQKLRKCCNVNIKFIDISYYEIFKTCVKVLTEEHIGLFNNIRDNIISKRIIDIINKNNSDNNIYILYFGVFHIMSYDSINDIIKINNSSNYINDLKDEYKIFANKKKNYNIAKYLEFNGFEIHKIYLVCKKNIGVFPIKRNELVLTLLFNENKIKTVVFNKFFCDYPLVFDYPNLKLKDVNKASGNNNKFIIDGYLWDEKKIAMHYLSFSKKMLKMNYNEKEKFLSKFCFLKECYESSYIDKKEFRYILIDIYNDSKIFLIKFKLFCLILKEYLYYDDMLINLLFKQTKNFIIKLVLSSFVLINNRNNKLLKIIFKNDERKPHLWFNMYFEKGLKGRRI
jgi:hypothetical protein